MAVVLHLLEHKFPFAAGPAVDQIEQPRIREDAFDGGTGEQADDAGRDRPANDSSARRGAVSLRRLIRRIGPQGPGLHRLLKFEGGSTGPSEWYFTDQGRQDRLRVTGPRETCGLFGPSRRELISSNLCLSPAILWITSVLVARLAARSRGRTPRAV